MNQEKKTKNRKRHLTPEFQVIRQSESNSKFFVASGQVLGMISSANSVNSEW